MENILTHLDNLLETFFQKNNKYPSAIILSQEIKDKIYQELDSQMLNLDRCWKDNGDNYRGIPLKIDNQMELIKLEG